MSLVRILLSVGAMALFGVAIGSLLSAYALIVYLIGGAAPFIRNGTTFVDSVALYYVGGTLGGLAVGLLLPFLKGRVGAAVGGAVAMLPVYGAAAYALEGPAGLRNWPVYAVCALVVGVPVGLTYRRMFGDWYDAALEDEPPPPNAAA